MNIRPAMSRLLMKIAPRAAVTMGLAGAGIGYGTSFHDLRGQLPVDPDAHYAERPLSDVKGVVWHHSATSQTATLNSIAKFHVEVRKWPAIAYHFAIDKDGVIYQLHDVTTASYQAQGYNRKTIGIVLIGDMERQEVPLAMEESIIVLNEYLRDEYHLEFAWLHNETKPTKCPGFNAEFVLAPYLYGPRPPARK